MNAQKALEIIKDELPFTSGVIEEALGLVKKMCKQANTSKGNIGI